MRVTELFAVWFEFEHGGVQPLALKGSFFDASAFVDETIKREGLQGSVPLDWSSGATGCTFRRGPFCIKRI